MTANEHAESGGLSARRWVRQLQWILFAVGLTALGYCGYVVAEAAVYYAHESRQLDEILRARQTAPGTSTSGTVQVAPGDVVARLEIPSLGVSAMVREGQDSRTLRLAIGHIAGTALPGAAGNVGLAAHRDTFFRRLGEVKADDTIRLVTLRGTFTYRVSGTRIVEPDDVWVLDPTDEGTLTLVTCYPFVYVGAAPRRFIVQARLIA
jgi:sortase A